MPVGRHWPGRLVRRPGPRRLSAGRRTRPPSRRRHSGPGWRSLVRNAAAEHPGMMSGQHHEVGKRCPGPVGYPNLHDGQLLRLTAFRLRTLQRAHHRWGAFRDRYGQQQARHAAAVLIPRTDIKFGFARAVSGGSGWNQRSSGRKYEGWTTETDAPSGVASGVNSYAAVLVLGLVSFAVFHPVAAATVAVVALAVGIALFALLASRVRRGWQRRRDARLRRRALEMAPVVGGTRPANGFANSASAAARRRTQRAVGLGQQAGVVPVAATAGGTSSGRERPVAPTARRDPRRCRPWSSYGRARLRSSVRGGRP